MGDIYHIFKKKIQILHKLFQKIEEEGTLLNSLPLYQNQIETLQENKIKPQTIIPHEHRHKNPIKILVK